MGFRVTTNNPITNGVFSSIAYVGGLGTLFSVDAALNLYGPKYFSIVLDDFNQNRQNKGLVNIGTPDTKLSLPNYFSNDLGYDCDTNTIAPTIPRRITQAQIYTINEINKNNNNMTNYLAKAPTSSDILAILPIKTSTGVPTGSLLVEFSGSLQDNSRVYFGPVNIDRMAVKLLDDKGNILNLNGNDWCFTLLCECLYQY